MQITRRFNKAFLTVFLGLGICLMMMQSVSGQSINFDHFSTGFPLTGAHQNISCESCHVRGIFIGAPRTCSGCHNGSTAPGKSATHINSSNNCDECHNTTSTWGQVDQVDHGAVTGNCSSCHNGTIATGKHQTHIASSNTCDDCHTTTGWIPATFELSQRNRQASNTHSKCKHM